MQQRDNGNVCSTVTIDQLPQATKLHGCQLSCLVWLAGLTFSVVVTGVPWFWWWWCFTFYSPQKSVPKSLNYYNCFCTLKNFKCSVLGLWNPMVYNWHLIKLMPLGLTGEIPVQSTLSSSNPNNGSPASLSKSSLCPGLFLLPSLSLS